MKKEKIVLIEWDDASFNDGYYDEDNPDRCKLIRNHTVGHLIKADRKVVITSTDSWQAPDKCHRHISTIPRGMIRKLTYLRSE